MGFLTPKSLFFPPLSWICKNQSDRTNFPGNSIGILWLLYKATAQWSQIISKVELQFWFFGDLLQCFHRIHLVFFEATVQSFDKHFVLLTSLKFQPKGFKKHFIIVWLLLFYYSKLKKQDIFGFFKAFLLKLYFHQKLFSLENGGIICHLGIKWSQLLSVRDFRYRSTS